MDMLSLELSPIRRNNHQESQEQKYGSTKFLHSSEVLRRVESKEDTLKIYRSEGRIPEENEPPKLASKHQSEDDLNLPENANLPDELVLTKTSQNHLAFDNVDDEGSWHGSYHI